MSIEPVAVDFKKIVPYAKIPEYADADAAGLDLFACIQQTYNNGYSAGVKDYYYIFPGQRVLISTGIAFEIERGFYGKIFDRSGMAYKNGLITAAGVIDSNYRGEVFVLVCNNTESNILISHHQKIAQIVFQKYYRAELNEVEKLSETIRGNKGFGSTGK